MFEDSSTNLFVYVLIGATAVMGAVWYFLIVPIERRNHARKLESLQRKIKNHEEELRGDGESQESSRESGGTSE